MDTETAKQFLSRLPKSDAAQKESGSKRKTTDRYKPVPALPRYSDLRACVHCRLVKNSSQFRSDSCDNCDPQRSQIPYVDTTADFQGFVPRSSSLHSISLSRTAVILDPEHSFIARFKSLRDKIPGVYALVLPEKIDEGSEDAHSEPETDEESDDGLRSSRRASYFDDDE
jgi:RNA polymerase subunit RPABC4/transcription elongation factor Spt4